MVIESYLQNKCLETSEQHRSKGFVHAAHGKGEHNVQQPKPKESAMRFCDCTEIFVILDRDDNFLCCCWTADMGHSRHLVLSDFT